jgi:hypothetical protein
VTAGDEGQDIDLTVTEAPPKDQSLVAVTPFNPARQHEFVRTWVAFVIIAAVIAETLILTIAYVAGRIPANSLPAATAAIITPMVGIAGTVLGFYFGTHRHGDG